MLDVQDNDILDDHDTESHRQAYNAAFDELGLNWYWDPSPTPACRLRAATVCAPTWRPNRRICCAPTMRTS